ncbi:MAG: mannose-1-phosphate guanylyltransferase [Bacteroidales bacterium]|nr:mannose-1-phosphate guanylyltransferase [Bacteroidales bacterium]
MTLNPNNFCIIMAGGFGSRFWPLCSVTKPKQFIDLIGSGESMIQDTFRRFESICPRENIIVVTTKTHEAQVRRQIPDLLDYQVLCEPFRRNTAPCIAYAASVISEINPNANIVVTPSDHAIFGKDEFQRNMLDAISMVDSHDWIVTLGARPVNPNIKYGYIQFRESGLQDTSSRIHKVITFVEKPPFEMACSFINSGEFLWNAGIFVWRLPVLKASFQKHLPLIADKFFGLGIDTPAKQLRDIYTQAQTISVDYGIIEKADNVYVMEADFGWSDVETWDSLYMSKDKDSNGNAIASGHVLTYDTHNCIVHLNSEKYAVIQGLDDYIVAAGTDTLLICRRDQEEHLMKFNSDVELMKSKKKIQ